MKDEDTDLIKDYSLSDVQDDPLSFLQQIISDDEDIVFYQVEGRPVVLVNHPDMIQRVLSSKNKYYVKTDTPEMYMLKPILGEGMLTSDGVAWKQQRYAANEGFTKEYIMKFFDIMVEETAWMLDEWNGLASVELESVLSQLTLQIVGRSLFGSSLKKSSRRFGQSVTAVNKYMGHYDPKDSLGRLKFEKALNYIRGLVSDIIAERKKSGETNEDILSILMKKNNPSENERENEGLVDQIFTFLMAGHETTAKALIWTIYELINNPQKLKLLEQEIESVLNGKPPDPSNVHRLEYTWMAIREGIRLNPPVWIMSRTAAQDDEIGGVKIHAGTTVIISPYLIHRHKRYWNDPELYIPERFSLKAEQERDPFTYIPFSGGPRKCIGMNFANIEMVIVLAMIVQKYQLRLKKGFSVEREALVTLRPRFGMEVLLLKKHNSP